MRLAALAGGTPLAVPAVTLSGSASMMSNSVARRAASSWSNSQGSWRSSDRPCIRTRAQWTGAFPHEARISTCTTVSRMWIADRYPRAAIPYNHCARAILLWRYNAIEAGIVQGGGHVDRSACPMDQAGAFWHGPVLQCSPKLQAEIVVQPPCGMRTIAPYAGPLWSAYPWLRWFSRSHAFSGRRRVVMRSW